MGKLKEAVVAARRDNGPRCGVAVLREQMDPEMIVDLDEMLAGGIEKATVIAEQIRVLTGFDILPQTLLRHRRTMIGKSGGCLCQR
jgi:hypothetical protein